MTKLRVAVIFSGQPRCIDGLAYDSFKKCILDRYDVDVYAHFWEGVDSDKTTGNTADNIELFKRLYSPKAIKVDPPLRADEYPIEFIQRTSKMTVNRHNVMSIPSSDPGTIMRNCISFYESMKRAYDVYRSCGDTHDWVIRARSDCVLLRCPELDKLNPSYIYTPHWHGWELAVLVNIAILIPAPLAPSVFSIRDTVEHLPGVSDEWFIFNHLDQCGLTQSIRTLPKTMFYPTLTRNGIVTDHPEPHLVSEVVAPPYTMYTWSSNVWTQTSS